MRFLSGRGGAGGWWWGVGSVVLTQEGAHALEEGLGLFDVRHVTGLGEDVRARVRYSLHEGLPHQRHRLIMGSGHDQRRYGDVADPVHDAPVPERPDDVELTRSVHR